MTEASSIAHHGISRFAPSWRTMQSLLTPPALLLILAVLRGCGVELNLFHLVALILAAGLGLDYALFFDHAGDDRADHHGAARSS